LAKITTMRFNFPKLLDTYCCIFSGGGTW